MNWLIKLLGGTNKEELRILETSHKNDLNTANAKSRILNAKIEELKQSLIKSTREHKNEYNRAQKYYIRCRRTIDFIKADIPKATVKITRKHVEKIVNTLDGASNDGEVKN